MARGPGASQRPYGRGIKPHAGNLSASMAVMSARLLARSSAIWPIVTARPDGGGYKLLCDENRSEAMAWPPAGSVIFLDIIAPLRRRPLHSFIVSAPSAAGRAIARRSIEISSADCAVVALALAWSRSSPAGDVRRTSRERRGVARRRGQWRRSICFAASSRAWAISSRPRNINVIISMAGHFIKQAISLRNWQSAHSTLLFAFKYLQQLLASPARNITMASANGNISPWRNSSVHKGGAGSCAMSCNRAARQSSSAWRRVAEMASAARKNEAAESSRRFAGSRNRGKYRRRHLRPQKYGVLL